MTSKLSGVGAGRCSCGECGMCHPSVRILLGAMAMLGWAGAAEVGFLVPQGPTEVVTPEVDTARELARRIAGAKLIWNGAGGTFVGEDRQPTHLGRFGAIWCHVGAAATPTGPI